MRKLSHPSSLRRRTKAKPNRRYKSGAKERDFVGYWVKFEGMRRSPLKSGTPLEALLSAIVCGGIESKGDFRRGERRRGAAEADAAKGYLKRKYRRGKPPLVAASSPYGTAFPQSTGQCGTGYCGIPSGPGFLLAQMKGTRLTRPAKS